VDQEGSLPWTLLILFRALEASVRSFGVLMAEFLFCFLGVSRIPRHGSSM
jgi:hypothetical protein